MKEAAVQRRHNLYRDSIVLTNSDPNLHLLGEKDPVDWSSKFTAEEPPVADKAESTPICSNSSTRGGTSSKKRRQVVSMIQLEGVPLPYESCFEVPGVDFIPEEDSLSSQEEEKDLKSPDSVNQIRDLINPVVQVVLPVADEENVSDGTEQTKGMVIMEDGIKEEVTHVTTVVENVPRKSIKIKTPQNETSPVTEKQKVLSPISKTFPQIDENEIETCSKKDTLPDIEKHNVSSLSETSPKIKIFLENETKIEMLPQDETIQTLSENSPENKRSPLSILQHLKENRKQEVDKEEAAIKSAIHELDNAVQDEDSDQMTYGQDSDSDFSVPMQNDFQLPTNDRLESDEPPPITNGLDKIVDPADVEVIINLWALTMRQEEQESHNLKVEGTQTRL